MMAAPLFYPNPKQKWLPKAKRMTLISAFRGSAGIALCADTQETVTYYDEDGNPFDLRKAVQKISPLVTGGFQIAIAGSGNPTLIEAFIIRAKRRLQNENLPAPNIEDAERIIEDELALFYRNDVVLCPDTERDQDAHRRKLSCGKAVQRLDK